MRLERERDIPAFIWKTWRERIALRDRAKKRDHWIIWIQALTCLTIAPILALSHWLGVHLFPDWAFIACITIYIVLSYPVYTVFCALFVTPRIRKALESEVERSA